MAERVGVFLSRMQPLHIGHIGMIKKALSENDRVIILIGSANKKETARNPMEVNLRREILEETLENDFTKEEKQKITVNNLPDWTEETDMPSNLEWGRYLYYNVVRDSKSKEFYNVFFGRARNNRRLVSR